MPDGPPAPRVVAAVLVEDPARLRDTVLTARVQSLEPTNVVAIGGGAAGRDAAGELDVDWVSVADDLELGDETSHLWFLRDDVEARPDALASLVVESERVEATVAGSKVLDAARRGRLISIGGATDSLCVPVPILDPDELDQGQYDVIRDVAYIPSQSVLIRRDAFRGLGGLDRLLAPDAAGIDFGQRARLAGGRVVVVPSSEVFSSERFAAKLPPWRELAGQLRALLKAYAPISLLWAIPLWLAVTGLTSVGWTLIGKPSRLADFVKAVAWNLKNAGSLARQRRRVQAVRQVGDEELFRYQTSGSHGLSVWWQAALVVVRRPLSSGQDALDRTESGLGEGLVSGAVLAAIWLVGIRSVLAEGLPFGAWTGPLADPADVLAAYAGGWHPAAMGGDGPPHPAAALLAVIGVGLGGSAATWGMALAIGIGLIGFLRLGRTLRLGRWPSVIGAVVAAFGTGISAAGTEGGYQVVLAVAAIPWVAHLVLHPPGRSTRARIGRVARLGLATTVLAMAAPLALVIPIVVALVSVLLRGRPLPLLLAPAGVVLALPALAPWLLWYDIDRLAGPAGGFWEPPIWIVAAIVVAWVPTVLAGGRWWGAAIGGVLVGAGAVFARGLVPGREAWLAGFVALALGLGLVTAGAADRLARPGRARPVGVVASLGVVGLAIPVVLALLGGGGGLAVDEPLADVVEYLAARGSDGQERVVFAGVDHPGAPSLADGPYERALDPAAWSFDRAWVGPPGEADAALAATLDGLTGSPVPRPGAALADHGVRWVVTPAGSQVDVALSGRLDVFRLVTPDGVVFEASDRAPIADSPAGRWSVGARVWEGPPTDEVTVAVNPTERWAAIPADVGVVAAGTAGRLDLQPDETLLVLARIVAGFYGVALVAALWGRRST
ncbi:MAG: hypothetical protein AB1Z55_05655 [Acidimicrobiia bacterium]